MPKPHKKPGRRAHKPGDKAFNGEKLKELRGTAEMSQEELAEAVGRATSDISRYERGEFDPSFSTAVKLAAVFGVSLDVFKKS